MSPARRRRQRGPAQCRTCRAQVAFFRSPFTGQVRAFNPKPIDMRTPMVEAAYPVYGRSAYRLADVVDLLMAERLCTRAEAEEEARDLPWHTFHACADDWGRSDNHHTDDHTDSSGPWGGPR